MSLVAGTRVGPYEIQSAIGAGGMGEVYKARDTRLDRTVAIKVLPPDVSGDLDPSAGSGSARAKSRADRRARFEREAKTVAGLNHPNICVLHDVGDHDGAMFLVMEHLAGQTLAERLEKGALPLEQALTVATEIADALSAAHRQGVIHRDLKPANVMLTKAGAKLLDFGLAKLTGHGEEPAAAQMVSAVPTHAATLTGQGVIVGTLQYMAPEQLEGKPPDARTDLWALGAVLYEMVTAKRAFQGTSVVSLMGAILEREPTPIASLQPLTPPLLDRLVRRCLAKLPEDRPDGAHDVADELRWIREALVAPLPVPGGGRARRWRRLGIDAVLMVLTAVSTWVVLSRARPVGSAGDVIRSQIDVRPAEGVMGTTGEEIAAARARLTALALSPDGRTLVFVGRRGSRQQLFRRSLDAAESVPLAGTEDGEGPFFSPDGAWIGFWGDPVAESGKRQVRGLFKQPSAGGVTTRVCAATAGILLTPRGANWSGDGTIVFSSRDGGVFRVTADGSQADCLARPIPLPGHGNFRVFLPHLLPGNRSVLLTDIPPGVTPDPDHDRIVVQDLAGGPPRTILQGAADARYVSSGHLLYTRWGRLYAAPFDPKAGTITGPEAAVLDDVMQFINQFGGQVETHAAQVAVSPAGTLAYIMGGAIPDQRDRVLVWADQSGKREVVPGPPSGYGMQQVSADGRRILFRQSEHGRTTVWTLDTEGGRLRRLTHNGSATSPLWTPDGARVVLWFEDGAGGSGLAWIPADGSQPPTWLTSSESLQYPCQWTPDGRTLILIETPSAGPSRVKLLSAAPGGKVTVRPWRESAGPQAVAMNEPALSPDGRWLAYTSAETGTPEVYVESFATPGAREKVSVAGGRSPVWAPDSRTVFYTEPQATSGLRRMMGVAMRAGGGLSLGAPRPLFDGRWTLHSSRSAVNITSDGRRFVLVEGEAGAHPPVPATHIELVLNWVEELKAKVPPVR